MSQQRDPLYADLSALSESAFPKRCPTCGRVYRDAAEFIAQTGRLAHHSGLKAGEQDDGSRLVELYRTCVCGSTLLDYFSDRRDGSTRGNARRQAFGRLLRRLAERGVDDRRARRELIRWMRTGHSTLISRLLAAHETVS